MMAANQSRWSAIEILASENYIDKFDEGYYDDASGLIYLLYNKKALTFRLPIYLISEKTADSDTEEDAILDYYERDGLSIPKILNPHTVPRLVDYARRLRAWQKEVDNAISLAKIFLEAAIEVATFGGGGFGEAPQAVLSLPVRRFVARTAMITAKEAVLIGKIGRTSSDLARLASAARVTLCKTTKPGVTNFAAVELMNAAGQLEKRVAESESIFIKGSRGRHSEEVVRDALSDTERKSVTRLYSERQPCARGAGLKACSDMLKKEFPNAKITWTYDYTTVEIRRTASADLKEANEALIRFFEAGGVPEKELAPGVVLK